MVARCRVSYGIIEMKGGGGTKEIDKMQSSSMCNEGDSSIFDSTAVVFLGAISKLKPDAKNRC